MTRLLVNDCLSALPDHRTFWNDLMEWFGMEFCGGSFQALPQVADALVEQNSNYSLIVRNASYFGPLKASEKVPTISLLQDIMEDGPQRETQMRVIESSEVVVFNSEFTRRKYTGAGRVIPLPVDFSLFEPGNPMGLQQALSLPDGCVCWIGASQGAAGQIKGYDIFLSIVRQNPDIPFVAVFKDAAPEYVPPNMRTFSRVTHEELVQIIGACRVGLCTSRMESQHLAGIEMGACGLPMVAPPVGVYFGNEDRPGDLVSEPTVGNFTSAIRKWLAPPDNPTVGPDREICIRAWWREFDRPIIRAAWEKLITEVESC